MPVTVSCLRLHPQFGWGLEHELVTEAVDSFEMQNPFFANVTILVEYMATAISMRSGTVASLVARPINSREPLMIWRCCKEKTFSWSRWRRPSSSALRQL